MTLGRTSSGNIKIKTDTAGGGLRAVECACCGGCFCNPPGYIDQFPELKTKLSNWTSVTISYSFSDGRSGSMTLAKYTSCLDPFDPFMPPMPFDFCNTVPPHPVCLGIATPNLICVNFDLSQYGLSSCGNSSWTVNGIAFPAGSISGGEVPSVSIFFT